MTALDWQDDALCRQVDTDLWFPPPGGTPAPAKAICRRCPVQFTCLELAVANDIEHGVYGGTTPTERRHLQRHRQTA
jgi:WhiB family redox-sensing transcriptional regulator